MPIKFEPRGAWWWARGTLRAPGKKSLSVYESTGLEVRDFPRRADVEAAWETRRKELVEGIVLGARAAVSFAHAADGYLNHEPRSETTKFHVERLRDHFGATKLAAIDQDAVDTAVTAIVGDEAAPATKRRGVIGPLTAVLMHAHGRKWCDLPKFDQPKVPRAHTAWLAPRDALKIEAAAAPHLRPLIRFLLCTGARLSEALDLDWGDVDLHAATVRLRQKGDRIRIAKLPPASIAALANQPYTDKEKKLREGHVFRRDDGQPYADRGRLAGGQIKNAWRGACLRAGFAQVVGTYVDKGGFTRNKIVVAVTPHDCRHSFASWFYGLTKDPFLLKREGGWETLSMVERYAHLIPSELLPDIALVWGPTHPAIGALPRANLVQPLTVVGATA